MKTINGTVTEQLTVTKDVQIEVPDPFTEEMVKEAMKEKAYAVTINDCTEQHGWSGIQTHSIEVDWVELKLRNMPYEVIAGSYDAQEINTKYANAFATMDEALEAFDKCQGYPWQTLLYKGRVLMGVES